MEPGINHVEISTLKEWDRNHRNISEESFDRLKTYLLKKGQFKPLIVTPDAENNGYIVLGGNMRLRAYKSIITDLPPEQAASFNTIWVSVVSFIQKEDTLWRAIVQGEEQIERFNTKEDGMMAYNLADNDEAGSYDAELMANDMPNFNLDWSEYAVAFEPTKTIQDFVDSVAPDPTGDFRYSVQVEVETPEKQQELATRLGMEGYNIKAKVTPIIKK